MKKGRRSTTVDYHELERITTSEGPPGEEDVMITQTKRGGISTGVTETGQDHHGGDRGPAKKQGHDDTAHQHDAEGVLRTMINPRKKPGRSSSRTLNQIRWKI